MASTAKTVTDAAAVQLFDATTTDPNDRRKYRVHNMGTGTIYLSDDSGVTASAGYPLASGSEREWDFSQYRETRTFAMYAICASGDTADVRVEETLMW